MSFKKAVIIIGITAVVFLTTIVFDVPLNYLDLKLTDLLFEYKKEWRPEKVKIVMVAIDEASANSEKLGRKPWNRSAFAELLKQLTSVQPSVIVFDINFVLPSKNDKKEDQILANAIRDSGRVLLASYYPGNIYRGSIAENLVKPWPIFEEVALGTGFANFELDSDKSVRKVKVFDVNEHVPGSFDFSMSQFENGMTTTALIEVIRDDLDNYPFLEDKNGIIWLNEMLERSDWYSLLVEKKGGDLP